jgi:hypothetical protein
VPNTKNRSEYFNNPGFFENEVRVKQATKIALFKTVESEGKTEQKRINQVDWKKELGVFSAITLNKSSYSGKYTVDSTNQAGWQKITYSTNDPKLPIKRFVVCYSSGIIHSLEAFKNESSSLVDSELHWRYLPDSGFSIYGLQKVTPWSYSSFRVSAIFVSPNPR